MPEAQSMWTNSSEEREAALRIARFIVSDLEYGGPADDFLGSEPVRLPEAIDSAALLELATFIEDEFAVQIQDEDIVPENFATVADVVRLLRDKGALSAPTAAGDQD
jgi:acyl carrier protein